MSKIKLILVDDELTSRNTIKNFLMNNKEYEIVADFSDGKSALDWLRKNEADILLCDIQMPEMNGGRVNASGTSDQRIYACYCYQWI